MHFFQDYEDIETPSSVLKIGLYLNTGPEVGEREWEITSIQKAEMMPPYILTKFIQCFEYVFPQKVDPFKYEGEGWYIATLKFNGYSAHDFEVISVDSVNDTPVETDRIH